MKNWKTTLGGILAAFGSVLIGSQTGVLHLVGQILQVVGVFLVGASAQDAPSTSKSDSAE